jgi:hypothetical protein
VKRYKLPGTDQSPAELIQAGSDILLPAEIHKLINSIWNKKELQQLWKKSIVESIYEKVIKLTVHI